MGPSLSFPPYRKLRCARPQPDAHKPVAKPIKVISIAVEETMVETQHDANGESLPFPVTPWSRVLLLNHVDPDRSRDALADLCRAYWQPLYIYLLRRGHNEHDAKDFTQGFFECVISGDSLLNLSRDKGKFRAFLLACLNHFVSNERQKDRAKKRGGERAILSLEELPGWQDLSTSCSGSATAEMLYDRAWALALVNNTLARLGSEFQRVGKAAQFDMLRTFLPGASPAGTYEEAAASLGMTRGAFDVALHRFKQRFGKLLRDAVSQTVADETQVDEELQYLLSVWASAPLQT